MIKPDNAEPRQPSETILQGLKKMDRRDFFVTAGKLIIPTLGVLGLSLSIGREVLAAGCAAGTCFGACTNGCSSCVGSCTATCEGWNKGMVKSTGF